jgi:hypothetical protein
MAMEHLQAGSFEAAH